MNILKRIFHKHQWELIFEKTCTCKLMSLFTGEISNVRVLVRVYKCTYCEKLKGKGTLASGEEIPVNPREMLNSYEMQQNYNLPAGY